MFPVCWSLGRDASTETRKGQRGLQATEQGCKLDEVRLFKVEVKVLVLQDTGVAGPGQSSLACGFCMLWFDNLAPHTGRVTQSVPLQS